MSAVAIQLAEQVKSMSDSDVDYLWGFLNKRRNDALQNDIDNKLSESKNSKSLTDAEVEQRLAKLGIN
jgi:hypothetical protein